MHAHHCEVPEHMRRKHVIDMIFGKGDVLLDKKMGSVRECSAI